MIDYLDAIRMQFNDRVRVAQKRPGIVQLFAPLYHEDGDMVDIFLEQADFPDRIRVTDHGMTLMRLSYTYDIDSPTKERILSRLLSENGVNEHNGSLTLDTAPHELGSAVLQFAQTVAKVSSMRAFRREVIHSLFFEQLKSIVETKLVQFHPQSPYFPLPNQEEYEVDYCFNNRERPVFLFGVNSPQTARLATIACLKFATEHLRFSSAIVFEDVDQLSRKDRLRVLSASDKAFPTLGDFDENGEKFLARDIS